MLAAYEARDAPWRTDAGGSPPPEGEVRDGAGGGGTRWRTSTGEPAGRDASGGAPESPGSARSSYGKRASKTVSLVHRTTAADLPPPDSQLHVVGDRALAAYAFFADRCVL